MISLNNKIEGCNSMKNKNNRAIYFEEYVEINGIVQYLYHCGTSEENPVMLFLHGGPGSVESVFAHAFQEKWEEIYTVIHWDQRGAGKTLSKNPSAEHYPTSDSIMEDTYEIVQYLKKRYKKEKIVIFGHSFGSLLGSLFTLKYPNEVEYYIGVGQVVNMLENERICYEKIKEVIIQSNNKGDLKKLEAIGDYPGESFDSNSIKSIKKLRSLQGKHKLAVSPTFDLILVAFKSPIFKLSDILALKNCMKSNKDLVDYLYRFNLYSYPSTYEVPMYYILGGNDWQTPCFLAEKYYEIVKAPHKKFFKIPNAGHITMIDQPELFFDVIKEIRDKN